MAEKCLTGDSGIHLAQLNSENFANPGYSSSTDSSSTSLDESQEGYDYETMPPMTDKKYECPVCLMLLRNPVQTSCGHRFCHSCLTRWIRESEDPRCPNDNAVLDKGQIFPDNFAKREIMALTVRCPNHKNGCTLIKELREMEMHVDTCEYRLVMCPQVCGQKLVYSTLASHLNKDCDKRRVNCPHCYLNLAFDELQAHLQECPMMVKACDFCDVQLPRQQLEQHLQHECPNAVIKCVFHDFGCQTELSRQDMDAHIRNEYINHLQQMGLTLSSLTRSPGMMTLQPYPLQQGPSSQAYAESAQMPATSGGQILNPAIQGLSLLEGDVVRAGTNGQSQIPPGLVVPESLLDTGAMRTPPSVDYSNQAAGFSPSCLSTKNDSACMLSTESTKPEFGLHHTGSYGDNITSDISYHGNHELQRLHSRNITMEEKYVQQQQLILELQAKNSSLEKRVFDQESRIKEMRDSIRDFEARNCRGLYIWKIEKFSQLRKQALHGESSVLHSSGFYTDLYGYKLCIRLNINGVDSAQGTHISIFIHFMQGEFDDIIDWPFTGKITLSILDQNEICELRNPITETLISRPNLAAFQKPKSYRNHKGFGYVEFAPISVIEDASASYIKNESLIIKAMVTYKAE